MIDQAQQTPDSTFPTAAMAVKLLQNLWMQSEPTEQRKSRMIGCAVQVELPAGSR